MQSLPAVTFQRRMIFFMGRLIHKGGLNQFMSLCVCVCKVFGCVGVGCWNKAALCLVNLSHKCQLAGCYAITTAMYTCNTCCIWPHCCIRTGAHDRTQPAAARVARHSDPAGPTHRNTHCQIECGAESAGQDEGVIGGRGRLLLPSSPPSVNCYRIDSQAYVSDLVSCLFW